MRVATYAIAKTFSGRRSSPRPSMVCVTPGTDAAITPRPNIPIISRTTRVCPAETLLYSMNVVHDSQNVRYNNA